MVCMVRGQTYPPPGFLPASPETEVDRTDTGSPKLACTGPHLLGCGVDGGGMDRRGPVTGYPQAIRVGGSSIPL